MRACWLLIATVMSSSAAGYADPASAKPPPVSVYPPYTAFDLGSAQVPSAELAGTRVWFQSPGSPAETCALDAGTAVEAPGCAYGSGHTITDAHCALWRQSTPPTMCIAGKDSDGVQRYVTIAFKGGDTNAVATLEGKTLTLPSTMPEQGEIAFFSGKWRHAEYTNRGYTFDDGLPPSPVYVRSAHSAIYSVTWTHRFEADRSASEPFRTACKSAPHDGSNTSLEELRAFPDLTYVVCLDATTRNGWPEITDDHQTIVPPNSTGAIIVRHWPDVMPVVSASGVQVGLTTPGFEGGPVTPPGVAADTLAAGSGAGIGSPGSEAINTVVLIPPHQPGAFHLDLRLADANDLTKIHAVQGIDLIVDQRYVGAFRIGVGYDFNIHDLAYSAKTVPGSSQPEIFGTNASPFELVLGYSLYLDGFGKGRTYSLGLGTSFCDVVKNLFLRHVGLFGGIGAASIQGTSVDFLKSLYLGVEIEVSRNLSLSIAHVSRRTAELADGLMLGGPAPSGDIPTAVHIEEGWGFVLSVSTDFFRFAVQPTGSPPSSAASSASAAATATGGSK